MPTVFTAVRYWKELYCFSYQVGVSFVRVVHDASVSDSYVEVNGANDLFIS